MNLIKKIQDLSTINPYYFLQFEDQQIGLEIQ
jgi:hypothetical protein